MEKKKGLQEGPPIWVESLMDLEEWKERVKKYPATSTESDPPQYNQEKYKGGKWRNEK